MSNIELSGGEGVSGAGAPLNPSPGSYSRRNHVQISTGRWENATFVSSAKRCALSASKLVACTGDRSVLLGASACFLKGVCDTLIDGK